MGIFDFVKSVGEKFGIGSSEPKADDLKTAIDKLDIGAEKVNVTLDGDKAVLKGEVKDQTALEKAIIAIGNTLGIAKVDADGIKVAQGSAKEPVFYEVKKGDNLSKIAEAVYGKGNANQYKLIFEANRPMLTHPDKIYPGQRLRIPELTQKA